ncbi:MAG: SOS response-associated peptidase [Saprospiraceae bacterium]|nr:SOS response-associated peptidase [Saprospiraceae bacterium]MBK7810053.1 SOS response-associated peptidase [Saprospiraceae bacterium]MBK9629655.1 SOS response-associated peptidase [Saprospiraceae bacterium]
MCGRGSLTKVEKELEERFGSDFYSKDLERYNPIPNFNIAPTHILPVILQEDPLHFQPVKWGLIPSWAKDKKIGSKMINARKETLGEKSTFKTALIQRRCLIPMDGFYEWKINSQGIKIPYRIGLKNFELYAMAGIYDRWKDEKGETIISCSIITLASNDFMLLYHDRMPAIMLKEEERWWLDPAIHKTDELLELIKAYPDDGMEAYAVSDRVNSVRNNEPSLILQSDDLTGRSN